MELVANGHGWKLSKSVEPWFYMLELQSEFGTVELKLKGVHERGIGYDILRVYEDLKAQGPLLVESQVE